MYHLESRLAQLGSQSDPVTGAVSTPIYQATVFRHPRLGQSTGYDYARTKSPTRAVLEQEFAGLEEGHACFAFSSGMAAVHHVFMLFQPGDHLLVSLDLYGGTYRLLEQVMRPLGITATYVDTNDEAALQMHVQPGKTKAIFIETPTNPLMMVTDLARICAWAQERHLLTIVDNTLLTPYFQRPLTLGADIVVHSATKYLAGHNDVLAGLLVTREQSLSQRLAFLQNSIGAVLAPLDAWLLLRGMKTLALRMERHQQNALHIASWLQRHPLVRAVYYPGLPTHPHFAIQQKQAGGNTGIFSFTLHDARDVEPILRHIRLIAFAESLGGVESLMTYPAVQTHADIPLEIRQKIGVDDALLRFSVGIEHVDDLIADLSHAFACALHERTNTPT